MATSAEASNPSSDTHATTSDKVSYPVSDAIPDEADNSSLLSGDEDTIAASTKASSTLEVFEMILEHVDPRTVSRAQLVNKTWCANVRGSFKLRQVLFYAPEPVKNVVVVDRRRESHRGDLAWRVVKEVPANTAYAVLADSAFADAKVIPSVRFNDLLLSRSATSDRSVGFDIRTGESKPTRALRLGKVYAT